MSLLLIKPIAFGVFFTASIISAALSNSFAGVPFPVNANFDQYDLNLLLDFFNAFFRKTSVSAWLLDKLKTFTLLPLGNDLALPR